ncbi:MAG: ATP-dependent DNA helicase RecQ [Bacteroidales bacterium]|nr:ATP-dependent DNA helicase RecQ [Bacteroidales bacterium]
MKQRIAGYIFDNLFPLFEPKSSESRAFGKLANWLSHFQINSKTHFEQTPPQYSPGLAVLVNLIQRGQPTRLNLYALQEMVKRSSLLTIDHDNLVSINAGFKDNNKEIADQVLRSLHIIDPRLNRNTLAKTYHQSWEKLDSPFEEGFLYKKLPSALGSKLQNNADFILQLMAKQRSITSITVDAINKEGLTERVRNNFQDQRTDFSIEFPYHQDNKPRGIVVEIDGTQHNNDSQRYLDTERNKAVAYSGWHNTLRISTADFTNTHLEQKIINLLLPAISNLYIKVCYENYCRTLLDNGLKQEILEICLIPFAIARIQLAIIESLARGFLTSNSKAFKLAVLERDVPFARIALDDLLKLVEVLNSLTEKPIELPEIDLHVFNTTEFAKSKFQIVKCRLVEEFDKNERYDLLIDLAVLERDQSPPIIACNATEVISIRSVHYIETQRKVQTQDLIKYRRFFRKIENTDQWVVTDKIIEGSLQYLLQSIFRKKDFRDGQLPILNSSLQCKSVIGLLPTGGGKSLTYQLSALLQPGICLVIDPIRSLMKDQVDGLNRNLIDNCIYINSTLQGEAKRSAMRRLAEGKAQFVFVSPERLQMEDFRTILEDLYKSNIFFSYCVIDEAHCVSEWGHDFRTAYLRLGENAIKYCKTKNLESLPLFGLTATASYDVLADVQRELSGNDERNRLPEDSIVRAEFTKRHELQYLIEEVDFPEKEFENIWGLKNELGKRKQQRALQLVNEIPYTIIDFLTDESKIFSKDDWEKNEKKEQHSFQEMQLDEYNPNLFYLDQQAALIFCPHTKGIFGVTDKFKVDKNGNPVTPREGYFDVLEKLENIKAGFFIGSGDDSSVSSIIQEGSFNNQDKFINNDLNLMVATKAFGMGIDKENIRFTIHTNYPGSIESFVQEAGRAGRDRKLALSYILFNDQQVYLKKEKQNIEHDLETNMYFHLNSFKGELKELTVLDELLNEIYLPDRTFELENLINNEFDIEVKCNYWEGGHAKNLYIELGYDQPLGYLDLNTLSGYTNYLKKGHIQVNSVNPELSEQIWPLIKSYIDSLNLTELVHLWLQRSDTKIGIERILQSNRLGEKFKLTVGFYNNTKERVEFITKWLKETVHKFFKEETVRTMKSNSNDADAFIEQVCEHYKKFTKGKEIDFTKHCLARDKIKKLPSGTAKRRFMEKYNGYRDKMDTEKAIYRLSTLGIIDDYTVNFSSGTFTLYGTKKNKTDYFKHLKAYLLKYYSETSTNARLNKLDEIQEPTTLRQYLNFLVHFVYDNIRTKRQQAIQDMKKACREALNQKENGPVWLKEFIDLYFNSKYARDGYTYTDIRGKVVVASLTDLTEKGKIDKLDFVWFFMNVMDEDRSGGSQIDNIKHLRGACTRMTTSILEPMFCIEMLHAFALYMLEFRTRRYLEEAEAHLFEAFSIYQEKHPEMEEKDIKKVYDRFVKEVKERNPQLQSYLDKNKMEFDFDSVMIKKYLLALKTATSTIKNLNQILQ